MGEPITARIMRHGRRSHTREYGIAFGPPDGGPNPPILFRFPEHGGTVCAAAGPDAKGHRLCRGHPAEASVAVPRRDDAGRLSRGDEGPHRGREATDAGVLPRTARLGACRRDQGAALEDQSARGHRGRGEGHDHPGDRFRHVRAPDLLRHRARGDERRQARSGIPRGN